MKINKTRIEAWFIYFLLGVTLVILILMYQRLDRSVDDTAKELLNEKSHLVTSELDLFFDPVENVLEEEWLRFERGDFRVLDTTVWRSYFFPLVEAHPAIAAVFVADEFGNQQFAGILGRSNWYNLHTFSGNKTEVLPISQRWTKDNNEFKLDSVWSPPFSDYDPRERVWFQSALESDSAIWTAPYVFSASFAPGITVAKQVHSDPKRVIAFDITLDMIAQKTTEINVTPSGAALVLTDSGQVIGYPYKKYTEDYYKLRDYSLSHVDTLDEVFIKEAYHIWEKNDRNEEVFNYSSEGGQYWAGFSSFQIGNQKMIVGVVAPEDEIVGPINKTKKLLLYGMLFILIVSIVLVQAYRQKIKSNTLLADQKKEIEMQKHLVDVKNTEIIDSITYAKRIQKAILPSDKRFSEMLPSSFVFYLPKDIVAGDFYWLEPADNKVLFAAADCTGHGVPGAMVSVVCNNALNRSVREFGLTDPGEVLDKTREIVLAEFEKSEEDVKDGMDIAICMLEGNKLKYAGAHNPLWIIRKNGTEVEEIKANKQPIGKYAESKPFNSHVIELNPGDTFYIFSDGFADQFGGYKGKKFKAAKFKKLLVSVKNESMDRQKELLFEAFEEWKGNLEQLDDVCVIGVKI